jgi:putative hydroxymethylpyrimidine transport system permease protein
MTMLTRGLVIFAGLMLLWEAIVWGFSLPPYILPAPLAVFKMAYASKSQLALQAIPTMIETLLGLMLGILLGCFAALVMAFYRPVTLWFMPLLLVSQALPTFAIAPLLVIWFGYGMASKIAITVLMLFFPVTSAFFDGLKRTEPAWLDLSHTMQAKKWQVFWHIRIPAALPALASGIRVATAIAPIGAVVGEWVGASQGLGYLMLNANGRMQIDMMFAALFIIVILSLALYFSVDKLLRWALPWQQETL